MSSPCVLGFSSRHTVSPVTPKRTRSYVRMPSCSTLSERGRETCVLVQLDGVLPTRFFLRCDPTRDRSVFITQSHRLRTASALAHELHLPDPFIRLGSSRACGI